MEEPQLAKPPNEESKPARGLDAAATAAAMDARANFIAIRIL